MSGAARNEHFAAFCTLALALAGCLDNKVADEPETGEKRVFIAQQRDFGPYRDWMTFEQNVMDEHGGLVGTTTVYLNDLPPDDASQFPVGTIIVKTMEPADQSRLTIHAMSKRGSGFNSKGTLNWEFFELALSKKSSTPIILWRGENPPSGESYQALLRQNDIDQGGMTEQKCNDCHASARDGTFDDLADLLSAR